MDRHEYLFELKALWLTDLRYSALAWEMAAYNTIEVVKYVILDGCKIYLLTSEEATKHAAIKALFILIVYYYICV